MADWVSGTSIPQYFPASLISTRPSVRYRRTGFSARPSTITRSSPLLRIWAGKKPPMFASPRIPDSGLFAEIFIRPELAVQVEHVQPAAPEKGPHQVVRCGGHLNRPGREINQRRVA